MLLLLFVAVEVLACDFLPSSTCFISSHSQDKDQGQGSGDDCLCCCAHVVVVKPLVFEPHETVVPASREETVQQPLFTPSHIDHPPRLS